MRNLAKKDFDRQNKHYWMLWVSPNHEQTQQLKSWPTPLKDRVLLLRPRKPELLLSALLSAIESEHYAMITLPVNCLCELDKRRLSQAAKYTGTTLAYKS